MDKKNVIISVKRFLSRSIDGKIFITLCDIEVNSHQTNSMIGNPKVIGCFIIKCFACKYIKLSGSEYRKTYCCDQLICNKCYFSSKHIHICSRCGYIRCDHCYQIRYVKCGSCNRRYHKEKEYCNDCFMWIVQHKEFRCRGCKNYPRIQLCHYI